VLNSTQFNKQLQMNTKDLRLCRKMKNKTCGRGSLKCGNNWPWNSSSGSPKLCSSKPRMSWYCVGSADSCSDDSLPSMLKSGTAWLMSPSRLRSTCRCNQHLSRRIFRCNHTHAHTQTFNSVNFISKRITTEETSTTKTLTPTCRSTVLWLSTVNCKATLLTFLSRTV